MYEISTNIHLIPYFSDPTWRLLPETYRNVLGFTNKNDGEFYMRFRDFLKYFGQLELCHLYPDSVNVNDIEKTFDVYHFRGNWQAGQTAGGCGKAGHGMHCCVILHIFILS